MHVLKAICVAATLALGCQTEGYDYGQVENELFGAIVGGTENTIHEVNPRFTLVDTEHVSWILAGSRDSIVESDDCILVGWRSAILDDASGSIVIGDDLEVSKPNSVTIGTELCGAPIPEHVRKSLKQTDPQALQWLVRRVLELNEQR